jgi:hypothetical protein
MYSVIPWNSANPISLCRSLGCRPKEKVLIKWVCRNGFPHCQASQCSLHNAPIFRLLFKVAVNGTHQRESMIFTRSSAPIFVVVCLTCKRTAPEFNTSGAVCAFTARSPRVETHSWLPFRVFLSVRSALRLSRSYIVHEHRLNTFVKVTFWNVKFNNSLRPWHLTTYMFIRIVKSQCARVQKHLCGSIVIVLSQWYYCIVHIPCSQILYWMILLYEIHTRECFCVGSI